MAKFNVGDKVQFVEDYMNYKKGDVVEVTGFWKEGIEYVGGYGESSAFYKRFKPFEPKLTKNQRITALEETVAKQGEEISELKLIVHELRGKKSIDPSTTNTVEDIIEFEGKQYRKVDREARKGDVIIVKRTSAPEWVTIGKSYKAFMSGDGSLDFKDDLNQTVCVYDGFKTKHTKEDVDVYELIEEGLNPQIPMVDETIETLTPNQQRAEIIEKAKKFVEENLKLLISYDFVVINNGLKLYSRRRYQDIQLTTAKCNQNDVYNEHIGKAIALGRALCLDVSEFEQAVQPDKPVIGMMFVGCEGDVREIAPQGHYTESSMKSSIDSPYVEDCPIQIINDTNAIYEVIK